MWMWVSKILAAIISYLEIIFSPCQASIEISRVEHWSSSSVEEVELELEKVLQQNLGDRTRCADLQLEPQDEKKQHFLFKRNQSFLSSQEKNSWQMCFSQTFPSQVCVRTYEPTRAKQPLSRPLFRAHAQKVKRSARERENVLRAQGTEREKSSEGMEK